MLHVFEGNWVSKEYHQIFGQLRVELPVLPIQNFMTTVRFSYDQDSKFRPTKTVEWQEMRGSIRQDASRYEIRSPNFHNQQMFLLIEHDGVNPDVPYTGTYYTLNPRDMGTVSLRCTTTCWGCLEDQPNQLAHMDPGGCLAD